MIELIFEFDEKGILPKDDYSISEYISDSKKVLELASSDKCIDRINKVLTLAYNNNKCENIELSDKVKQKFHNKFFSDISWVPSFKTKMPYDGLMDKFPFEVGGGKEIDLPFIVRDPLLVSYKTTLHELIHVVRSNLDDYSNFEETYADKFHWIKLHTSVPIKQMINNYFKIRKAENKLEDVVGNHKEYVSIRLNTEEICYIADTPNIDIKDYLKSKNQLRHKIIVERLDL